ncbi:Hypothetical predicted protein [Mytilus galloprovincialis]|uniref:Integrase catalytic domain-containing protein n=1 Tax=Mytilus galloprovincialis TaxID=29158 RepID=A0A8B6ESQ1_MYTGA|nr:Hypothetical predicted protein [Mytilus galloprovincialis]
MSVHIFGNTASTSIASYGLRQSAMRSNLGSDVTHFVLNDFYVDNGLTSLPTATEAVNLLKDTGSTQNRRKVKATQDSIKQQRESASVNAIDEARKLVLREAQIDTFSDEIDCLTTRKPLAKSSSIASLTPFLDKENMLRIGGRIQNSNVPDIEKHPILLSGRHHIALLIVRHYHELSHHQGRHITEGSIRSAGFWITGLKSLVSSVISKCVKCRILRGSLCTQKMAMLPPDRLEPGPPFTNVGVDCFGPWEVLPRRTRGGHANSKRWATMFTCLTTRAVHVEVIEELSSSSFIMALKRFTAIRGPVSHFRSDRGTNFVGSIKELGIQAINVEDGRMKDFLRNQGTTWQFNPPHASHMGGVWERVIGITRRILDSLLMEASRNKLTHEMLVTFLAEASAIVNSRPLVPLTTDPENPMPLSPSLLLTQKPQQIIKDQRIIDSKICTINSGNVYKYLQINFGIDGKMNTYKLSKHNVNGPNHRKTLSGRCCSDKRQAIC